VKRKRRKQLKTIEEIYQELLTAFAQRAGFAPEENCDLSVRLWAAAGQLQALEIQADWVLEQGFPQTAQGIYLDYHGQMRGIRRMGAAKAKGALRFSVEHEPVADLEIPADTVCMTAEETRFRTTEKAVLKAGTLFVDVPAEALEGGSSGNALAGAVCILTACPVAVTACSNPEAFSGGSDAERDDAFRSRILESYQRLPNGANAAWYEQTAEGYPDVVAAKAVGRARGIGTVDVYVAVEDGLPDEELLEGLREKLQEMREIAVDVRVKAPETRSVDVCVEVLPGEGMSFADVQAAVEQKIRTFFTGRQLGKPVRLAELGCRSYELDEVENYRFIAPAEDLAAEDAQLPVLGTLQIVEMEDPSHV